MVILAVDLGHVRTGLAVCDAMEMMAFPVGVINEKQDTLILQKIAAAAKEKSAQLIVMGHPKNMDGSEGESAQRAQNLAVKLEQLSGIKTVLWDERCSTKAAHTFLNQSNTRGEKRKAAVDALSAVIILESYLSYRRNGGNA
ncbi:MAG: Holliday junction resolvase RuvX [Oscillospiraceae bacterium]|jgi:putative Holliday junction resolvase|nr:Holliday junction resolvase RuvX [Oscillospiraceae bacterium]